MVCKKCNTEGVKNVVLGKEFYYCRTCKDEILDDGPPPPQYHYKYDFSATVNNPSGVQPSPWAQTIAAPAAGSNTVSASKGHDWVPSYRSHPGGHVAPWHCKNCGCDYTTWDKNGQNDPCIYTQPTKNMP